MAKNKKTAEPGKPRKKVRWGRILLTILLSGLLLCLVAGVIVAGWVFSLAEEIPELTAEDLIMAQTSFVYDREGREVGTLHGGENRVTVDLDDMPEYLIDAVIATEDVRFYSHFGVDVRSVTRALVVDTIASLRNREVSFEQGASTITMQLVRNVVGDTERRLERKAKEALLAIQFEQNYDKDQILYLYMNEIYTGPRVYGMAAAADYYFGKELQDISLSEAALLAGILRNPGYYNPYQQPERALNVRNTVLNNLINYDPDKYGVSAEAAKSDEMVLYDGIGDNTGVDYEHAWFVDYVISEASDVLEKMDISSQMLFSGGYHIYTTMDRRVQTIMEEAYANDENFLESKSADIVESGMAIMDPLSGEICGLVGGRRYETKRGFNRATAMKRQPGSSIKPIVSYGPAIDQGYGLGYVIDDSPFTGGYNPKNSDWAYQGRITMRRAIMQSRNVCAVKMLQTIGSQTGWSYAVNMGLPLADEDAFNSAIALGGVRNGVSPLDMAGAFSTFANGGIYTEPYCVSKITDARGNIIYEADPYRRQVMSEQSAYLVTDALMSAVSGGTGTGAKISGWQTAGKTGTVELPPGSEDPDYAGKSGTKDIWFCGYTPNYSCSVWMGYDNKFDANDEIQYMPSVYGGGPTAKLFNLVMTQVLEGVPEQQFRKPNGLAAISIDTKSGMTPSELTPEQFIGSELFDASAVPGGPSDIWEVVELCADSLVLANDYCPNKTTSVRMKVEEGQVISTSVADYEWYAPTMTCPSHLTMQEGLKPYYVCTDTRHGAERVLANVAAVGSSGGCPSEAVALRYYGDGYQPSGYCGLEDHQVLGQSTHTPGGLGGDSNNNNSGGLFGGGNSGGSSEEVTELQTPYNVAAVASTNGCLVSWSSGNDFETTIFVIEKMTDGDEASKVRFRTQGRYSYDDWDVEPGHSYTYRIYAYNADYNVISQWSTTASFTP